MNDLWPITFSSTDTEKNNAIEILREQARALENKTNKMVKATFSQITYDDKYSGVRVALSLLSTPLQQNEEIIEDELKGKKDIAELYRTTRYKFEIYNNTYRFRLFLLDYSEFFPFELIPDEGIKEEIGISTELWVNSNSELKSMVADIFSSKKVKNIIHHMMAESN